MPERHAALVVGVRGGAPLQPVAELRTERRLFRIRDGAGVLVEVADDQVRAIGLGGLQREFEWREVEAELGTGTERDLARVGKILRAAGARPATSSSKLARVIGSAEPAEAGGAPAARLPRRAVDGARDRRHRTAPRPRPDPPHPRRGTSRCAACCGCTARPSRPIRRVLDEELSWYQDLLGDVRDREVLRAHFDAVLSELAARVAARPGGGRHRAASPCAAGDGTRTAGRRTRRRALPRAAPRRRGVGASPAAARRRRRRRSCSAWRARLGARRTAGWTPGCAAARPPTCIARVVR